MKTRGTSFGKWNRASLNFCRVIRALGLTGIYIFVETRYVITIKSVNAVSRKPTSVAGNEIERKCERKLEAGGGGGGGGLKGSKSCRIPSRTNFSPCLRDNPETKLSLGLSTS